MATIRFTLREDKVLKNGQAPIELKYQISGQRKYYNTNFKTYNVTWDSKTQQAKYLTKKVAKSLVPTVAYDRLPTEKEIICLNDQLADLRKQIRTIESRFELDGIVYSVDMVIAKLKEQRKPQTKKEAPSNELYNFIDKYIVDHQATREPGSLIVYNSLKTHLKDYQSTTRKKLTFESIDYSFFQSFQNFLIEKHKYFPGRKSLNNTTVAKQLSTIKTFLNYARKQGLIVSDSYKQFKIKRENLEVIALTNEEFETLFYLDLSGNKRLCQVRDVFCFACTTGLRYSDLNQLKREHIKDDQLTLTIKKTKEKHTIPLTPYSNALLARYRDQPRPLPVISNQKMNKYVKELCRLAGIVDQIEIVRFRGVIREALTYPKYDLIGVHTGRKTFATLSLERGMSAEEVMTITGHKDYKSFKRYVKVTEQRKKTVMLKAWSDSSGIINLRAV